MASKSAQLHKDVCWVHARHVPISRSFVWHHIIPREWQQRWRPNVEEGAVVTERPYLWAESSILVCPTGHSNIHWHIMNIAEELQYHRVMDDMSWEDVLRKYKPRGAVRKELAVAKQAYWNWSGCGAPIILTLPERYRSIV
jgi:hypothetical protein